MGGDPQAISDAGNGARDHVLVLRDVRRPGLLADPRRLLLRPLRAHHAPPNTVRLLSSCPPPCSPLPSSLSLSSFSSPIFLPAVGVC